MWLIVVISIALIFACVDTYTTSDGEVVELEFQQSSKDDSVIPLEGLDPVFLTRGKETQGDEKFSVKRGRFRYLFASAETKATFEQEPGRYEIQLGGVCARMGPSTQGNPDLFTVHDGRIYIFGSAACVKMFKETPGKYLEGDAAASASNVSPPAEDSLRRGRALIEKAVAAAGGAARVDGIVSYQERGTVGSRTPQGVSEIKTALLLMLHPAKIRTERTLSFGTITTVVTPEGGFVLFPRGNSEMLDEQRAAFIKGLQSNPLAILRARRNEGFKAVAVGAGKAGDVTVEEVDVAFCDVRARLGIDPTTGRILSLAYRGRGDGGAFGMIVRTFSDFRAAGGLTLPFKIGGAFNGEAEPSQTSTVESIVVNGEISPALFEKPKPVGGQ